MKIGIDFDGVIADCGALKREGANRLFAIDIPEEKFKKEIVVGEGLLTLEQYRFLQKQIYGTRELGLLAQPITGAKEYIERLKKEGHKLTIITSRFTTELEIAKEWANQQGVDIELIGCEDGKQQACRDLAIDIFIDDDLEKLESLDGLVPHLYLFSHGYNQSDNEKPTAIRVFSWEDFYHKITPLS